MRTMKMYLNIYFVVSGMVIDSVPTVPVLWGSLFIAGIIPPSMFRSGYTIKYVTWFSKQLIKVSRMKNPNKLETQTHRHVGSGAGEIEIMENKPVIVETTEVMHMYQVCC